MRSSVDFGSHGITMGVFALAVGCASAPSPASLPSPPVVQVEYLRVEGKPCLQPHVTSGVPTDADLVAAQKRWLNRNYPDYRLIQQTHLLTLAPGVLKQAEEKGSTERDSLDLQTADGKRITECFSLVVETLEEGG